MIDVTMLASASVVGTFILGIAGGIAKLWYNHKKLLERVDLLETRGFLTVVDHDKERQICRAEVYRDISNLEASIERINKRLDRSEVLRDKAREEDQKWKEGITKSVYEIGAILKNEIAHGRLGRD